MTQSPTRLTQFDDLDAAPSVLGDRECTKHGDPTVIVASPALGNALHQLCLAAAIRALHSVSENLGGSAV